MHLSECQFSFPGLVGGFFETVFLNKLELGLLILKTEIVASRTGVKWEKKNKLATRHFCQP